MRFTPTSSLDKIEVHAHFMLTSLTITTHNEKNTSGANRAAFKGRSVCKRLVFRDKVHVIVFFLCHLYSHCTQFVLHVTILLQ